ncbi:MORN repeat-containing protein [Telluria sp. B2]
MLAAEPAIYFGKHNCRIAALEPAPRYDTVDWNGACEDGFAVGQGELKWNDGKKKDRYRLKATLVRGEVQGEGELKTADYTYIGTLRRGVPHGKGFFTYKSGMQYEGDVVAGQREGKGIAVETDRSEYAGEWKDGRPHGWGEMKYAEGGSYSGQWQQGKRHGRGKLVYAGSGRTFEGEFANDLIVGAEAQEFDTLRYAFLREDRDNRTTNGGIPLNQPWEALTQAQKNIVRSRYPALARGDDPPYPSKGPFEFLKAIAALNRDAGAAEGTLRMAVLVGADGKAKRADVFEKPSLGDPKDDQKLVKRIASILMLTPYKPAMCQGEPCEMVYPVLNEFIVKDDD